MNDGPIALFPTRIAYDEAQHIVAQIAGQRRLAAERIALARTHGRILAQDVIATLPQPPFDNAAMDGFAIRHADLRDADMTSLRLVGEQFAGQDRDLRIETGQCVRITTGAPLPDGADTVVMKENTRLEAQTVQVMAPHILGMHVRRTGEDIQAGDLLLKAGELLTPPRIALAAAQGLDVLEVARRPTVAVFTTGDELIEPGLPLAKGQIYNSNREQLMGLLRQDGLEPVAWPNLPDAPMQVESALRHAGHAFDVVITCGAVSAGEKDYIPDLLQTHGRVHFWKVQMKPGMPILLAEGGELGDALFLCLPGNPVSVLATYLTLGRSLLDGLQGRTQPRVRWHAQLASDWSKRNARLEFLRGRLWSTANGVLRVQPNPADGSHRMHAAADSNALIVLEAGARDYAAGSAVEVLDY